MNRKIVLKHLVILMFFMFIADILAGSFFWYYTIFWFDMIMHFLGGFWVGLFFIWFFSIVGLPAPKWVKDLNSSRKLIFKTILFVLFIGISWEVFEIIVKNHIGQEPFSILDTTSDIFFDLSGGVSAILYFFKTTMIPEGDKVKLN